MFLNYFFDEFHVAGMVPDIIRINCDNRTFGADSKAVRFGPLHTAFACKFEFRQSFFQITPRLQTFLSFYAFILLCITAYKDMFINFIYSKIFCFFTHFRTHSQFEISKLNLIKINQNYYDLIYAVRIIYILNKIFTSL